MFAGYSLGSVFRVGKKEDDVLKSGSLCSSGRNVRQCLSECVFLRVTVIKVSVSVDGDIFLKYPFVLFMFIVSFMPL